MALSRQKTPAVRTVASTENLSAKGAYEIKPASGEAKATLFGTGTELALALKAAETLEAEGVPTRVVSVPCFELFEQQDAAYRASVIGRGTIRVAIEAAIKQGWEGLIGEDGAFIGMTGFGASAPAEVLYDKFGITADALARILADDADVFVDPTRLARGRLDAADARALVARISEAFSF